MSVQRPFSNAMAAASLKWRELAERRRVHLAELYESGRWRLYYTEQQFLAAMREAAADVERWSRIAPRPDDAQAVS